MITPSLFVDARSSVVVTSSWSQLCKSMPSTQFKQKTLDDVVVSCTLEESIKDRHRALVFSVSQPAQSI
jgi:hypothetical protein